MIEQVYTVKGLLPRNVLEVVDYITEDEKARYVQTKWFHQGELVRQDAWVNLKTGVASELTGDLNG